MPFDQTDWERAALLVEAARERARITGEVVVIPRQRTAQAFPPVYRDTDEMPDERPVPCLNCNGHWHDHRGWACPHYWRPLIGESPDEFRIVNWALSQLADSDCYTTPDMATRNRKKFSRISPKKLRKLAREHLLSKESLLK